MGSGALSCGARAVALSAGWRNYVLPRRGPARHGARRGVALVAAPEGESGTADREHHAAARRRQEPRLLAGTSVAGTGPDVRSIGVRDRLLVRRARIFANARAQSRQQPGVTTHFRKAGNAAGGNEGAGLRLRPADGRDLGDYRGRMAGATVRPATPPAAPLRARAYILR